MVHMARAYLTEKQMPHTYWFFAITHAARMMNAIPGKYGNKGLAFALSHLGTFILTLFLSPRKGWG
jgi:hypothetical protein